MPVRWRLSNHSLPQIPPTLHLQPVHLRERIHTRRSINRMQGVSNNIQNATSYLDVQDGILQGAAGIVSRMAELKSLSQDVLKNESDIANYNTEFKNLQVQLYQISQETFNGVSLFAIMATGGALAHPT